MTKALVVAGTDTGVGKTVFAAALSGALQGHYWKPVQAGTANETDSEVVARLSGLPPGRLLPEAYRLTAALSPHRAAELEGIAIDPRCLALPEVDRPLIVEAAGGLMVPYTRSLLQIDLIARWRCPVVLVARTTLGTINHSLLSISALRARAIPVIGIAFVGDANDDSEATIADMGHIRRLGRLPHLDVLDRQSVQLAFAREFDREDFE